MASILIVDDIPAIFDMLKGLIGPSGHECTGATNGHDGLQKYQEANYDVVLVDYSMTPMDGIEFTKELLKIDPKALIILMTGHSDSDTKKKALDAGVFAMEAKPFQLTGMLQTIADGIKKRQNCV